MTFQRHPILEKLLPFVHADDASADYLLSGNYYEWYAGYAAALRPWSVLEIGTRRGYSLLAMLLACDSIRHVAAFDNESYGVPLADVRDNLFRLKETQEFAHEIWKLDTQTLDKLPVALDYDLIHVDGDHTWAGALHDLHLAAAALAEGGTIIVDDVTFYRDVDLALTEFLKLQPHEWIVDRIPSLRGHALLRRVARPESSKGVQSVAATPFDDSGTCHPTSRLSEVRDGMFRPTSFTESQEHVVGACNGHSSAERWAGEMEPFTRRIAHFLPHTPVPFVVDYGCGCGRLAKELLRLRPECFVRGIDTSAEQRTLANDYVASPRFESANADALNDGEGTVDLVYSVYCLQHVPAIELRDVIRRIHRVLKPDGRFVYCSSDYRLAVSARGFFDDRFLGVDVRQEIERLFVEECDLFDLAGESQLIRDLITAEGCPPGSIAHPAKVYRKG